MMEAQQRNEAAFNICVLEKLQVLMQHTDIYRKLKHYFSLV